MCCAVQRHTPQYSIPLIKVARYRAPSFASATEKSRAAAFVHPACPKLGLVVYGTSIDRWCASRKAGRERRWRCCDGVATPALPFCCGLEPACGIDMISIAHLASHLLTPGSRVADLNGRNGMSFVYCCFVVSHTRLVVYTIDHAYDVHDACDSARSPETLRD